MISAETRRAHYEAGRSDIDLHNTKKKKNKAQQANDGSLSNEAIFHLFINYFYSSWM